MHILLIKNGKLLLKLAVAINVCALLVATLWPLNPWPRNGVGWFPDQDGLRFESHGTILSAGQFPAEAGADREPFSLEIWMEPWWTGGSSVIVAFYVQENPEQFVIRQDQLDVSVIHTTGQRGKKDPKPLTARGAIALDKRTLITLTADPKRTTLYINGQPGGSSQSFGLSQKNLSGEFVIGTSPVQSNSWVGVIRGIAIYKNELTTREVSDHYHAGLSNCKCDPFDRRSMLALYLFRERSGSSIKNEIQPGVNLYIPPHYTIWRQNILLSPWKEFRPEWTYVRDVILNVLAFVPLGLVLYPYFKIVVGSRRPLLMTYFTAGVLSLAIEILQSLLPTRYSGWTDVITNSAGAALGASICFFSAGKGVLKKVFGEKV
jgi:VanZ family protein